MVTDPPYGVNYDPAWRNQAGRSIKWDAPADCDRHGHQADRGEGDEHSRVTPDLDCKRLMTVPASGSHETRRWREMDSNF
jgi:hypothetical protein